MDKRVVFAVAGSGKTTVGVAPTSHPISVPSEQPGERTYKTVSDPLDDEGQHALIEALALCGDRSGALEQYRVYSALIAEEAKTVTGEPIERIEKVLLSQ